MNFYDLPGPQFLALYGGAIILSVIFEFVARKVFAKSDCNAGISELHPYEVAFLKGGPEHLLIAALASLIHQGTFKIKVIGDAYLSGKLTPDTVINKNKQKKSDYSDISALVEELNHELEINAGHRTWRELRSLGRNMKALFEKYRYRLEKAGLVISASKEAILKSSCIIAYITPFLFLGLPKILIGISREKPVMFLVVLCGISVFLIFRILSCKIFRTEKGNHALLDLRSRNNGLETSATADCTTMSPLDIALAVGLFGAVSIPAYSTYFKIPPATISSSSGGTSCSNSYCSSGCGASCGGGCGGGCGGCGS